MNEWCFEVQDILKIKTKDVYLNTDLNNINRQSNYIYNPSFNIGVINDRTTGIPLLYETYYGLINEQIEYISLIEKAKQYNFQNPCLVIEKDFLTIETLDFIDENDYKTVIMVQNWNDNLQKLLDNNKEEITFNSDYLIGNQNLYGKHFKSKIFSNKNATYNVYLFFSIDKRDEIVSYYNKVYTSYRNQLKNIKNINNKEINNYKKYLDFECDSKGNILSIKINIESYQKAIQNVGYFVVISNIEKTAQEIYEIYKNKNNTEKAFSEIKNYSQLNNNFDEYDNGLEAKTFITFLSLIVRNFILYKCKSFLENHPSETFNTIMDELRKIQLTKVYSFQK